MIVIRLSGGLGNQLFQRAYGMALEHRGYEVAFDKSQLVEGTHREYSLGNFVTPMLFSDTIGPELSDGPTIHFRQERLCPPDPCTITGYFQTEKYFSDIERIVRQNFVLNEGISVEAQDAAARIAERESVFLHVRRQDYVGLQHYHGMPSIDYYRRALREVHLRHGIDVKPYVFTDDFDWCTSNFPPGIEIVRGLTKYEDLWLMSRCDHAVIANSSFSWWGAWFGDCRRPRTVVAPKQWFTPEANVDASDVCPERWTRI